MYHYTECGLDNVWLENGYTIHDTPYGKGVSISDADGLDKAVAMCLTKKPGRVTGKEFRFLRTLLGLAQHNLADMMGVTEQSISLWERTGKVPKQGDAAMRLIVLEKFNDDGRWSKMIERINAVDRLVNQQIVFREQRHKWIGKSQADKPEMAEA